MGRAKIPNLLSIAGSDPSGGAGIQADLKTFAAHGCYGMAVITALTAQNTTGVKAVHVPPTEFIEAEIDMIFEDIEVAAVKIGMLATAEIAKTVARRLAYYKPPHIVLDPVLMATSGDALASPDLAKAIHDELFPLASLITPNLPEAAIFSDSHPLDSALSRKACAQELHAQGARAVLIKGGHCHGEVSEDIFFDGASFQSFSAPRLKTDNTHGTGCTLAAAIAAGLAQGAPLALAISQAKLYLTGALNAAARLNVGGLATSPTNKGHGPLNHFFAFDKGTP